MTRRKRWTIGHLIAALALLAASCGSDGTAASQESTTGQGGGTTATGPATPTTVDPSSIDNNAKFVYAQTANIPGLDPIKSNSSAQWPLLLPIFDTLVHGNPDGTFGPGIASQWTLSPDGTTFTMTINQGRTFQDGTPIDAAAVKANLDRAISDPKSLAGLKNISSVTAQGNTVSLAITDKAGGRLVSQMATPAGMMVAPASFARPDIDTAPIGSGPFKVSSFAPDAISYQRWDGYHDAKDVHIADLTIRILADDNTRLAALKSGQLDATFLRPQQKSDADAAGNLKVSTWYSAQVYSMVLNTSVPALGNAEVRKAIMKAIDRDSIAKSLYNGGCYSTVQPHVPDTGGYNPQVTVDQYGKYDPAAVKKQLTDAGYANGFELRTAVPNLPQYRSLFEVIQAQLGEVGVKLVANVLEPTQWVDSLRNGKDEAWVSVLGSGQPDPLTFWNSFYIKGGIFNHENYAPADITTLYDKAALSIDANTQGAAIRDMVKSTVDNGPRVIPVCVPQLILATGKGINGVPLPVNFDFHFNGVTRQKS